MDVTSLGHTHEKRDVKLVTISSANLAKNDGIHPHGNHHHTDSELDANSQESGLNRADEKPVIYINCGIHAREWVAVSTCLWIIQQVWLLSNISLDLITNIPSNLCCVIQLADVNNTESMALLDTYDFWMVPVGNPDGYVYSWTTVRSD